MDTVREDDAVRKSFRSSNNNSRCGGPSPRNVRTLTTMQDVIGHRRRATPSGKYPGIGSLRQQYGGRHSGDRVYNVGSTSFPSLHPAACGHDPARAPSVAIIILC